ncbi:hypothetical protein SD939_10355 [Lactobacillus crispatus]|uniref:hypothetical protein n=1 Tax=Lactobacillus crispatus TaxID=47770 RepID=UPI0029C1B0C9|nr:hypothetical protein [Lactobacillus crispatus]MDX5091607.1 hypothetical protein [Lactobacillus crispatus]
MQFRVQNGTVKHNGVFHEKGAIFNAPKKDVVHLLEDGAVAVFEEMEAAEEADVDEETEQDELDDDEHGEIVAGLNVDDLVVDAPKGGKGRDK